MYDFAIKIYISVSIKIYLKFFKFNKSYIYIFTLVIRLHSFNLRTVPSYLCARSTKEHNTDNKKSERMQISILILAISIFYDKKGRTLFL